MRVRGKRGLRCISVRGGLSWELERDTLVHTELLGGSTDEAPTHSLTHSHRDRERGGTPSRIHPLTHQRHGRGDFSSIVMLIVGSLTLVGRNFNMRSKLQATKWSVLATCQTEHFGDIPIAKMATNTGPFLLSFKAYSPDPSRGVTASNNQYTRRPGTVHCYCSVAFNGMAGKTGHVVS